MSHHFILIKEEQIPELKSNARMYRHETTGARLLSIINDDENKCFSINFRTPPQDSSGVAHILEHSVLNGSHKYPIKEPFVELVKGSLATFINAITYPDKTCYPVASQNTGDFYNLIDVYMDAVLHPLISPMTFQQEGWHYEIERIQDPLTYKGVVFNEMKGAYSSPERVQEQEILTALFPEHTYGLSSGGDPVNIPGLSYEQFKQFHDTWYHPSNAYIFFSGNDDPENRLELMEGYLKSYKMIVIDSSIASIAALKAPVAVEVLYDAGQEAADGRKNYFTVNWVLPDHSDPVLFFSLKVLAQILIGTPASPLRKALIESGLGDDLTGLGLEEYEHRELLFSTGLKGISGTDASQVERLIFTSLGKLAEEGIEADMVEAALNTLVFQLRENNTGDFPRGLAMMIRVMTTWLYDQDPMSPIAFETPFRVIRTKLNQDDRYFEGLIRRYLLDNTFRANVQLIPDSMVSIKRQKAEEERLEKIRNALAETELKDLVSSTQALKKRQQTPDTAEALASLPVLKLADLDQQVKHVPLTKETRMGVEVLSHDLFTNGIVYLDMGFDLGSLPGEFLPLVTVFGRALLEMGTETEDYIRLSQRIGRHTGGIEIQPLCLNGYLTSKTVAKLFLRAKARLDQSGEMLAILQDVLLSARFDDPERFKQIVLEQKAGIETELSMRGDQYAYRRMAAQFTDAGWASEQIKGVTALLYLRKLVDEISSDWNSVLNRLESMRQLLINCRGLTCNVTLDAEDWQVFASQLDQLLDKLPDVEAGRAEWNLKRPARLEGLAIPSQVNCVGKAVSLYPAGYQLDGSADVIFIYLRMAYLWEKIRVQGGAYGAFCQFDHNSGILSLLSFRDPNVASTLESYDNAAEFLKHLKAERLSDEELLKSIIGAIGLLDTYQLPDAKGFTSMLRHLSSETDEQRQLYRDQVLTATRKNFNEFGVALGKAMGSEAIAVVGARETVEKSGMGLTITNVM
jgi:Zn-dependent M16 (insulinase) family peptidase